MDEQIVRACCPTQAIEGSSSSRFDRWTHYQSPTWWEADFYRPDRADATAKSIAGAAVSPSAPAPAARREREREAVIAHGGDVSPHQDGRAQPGDVIGVETGEVRTHVGETSEDENKRRRDATRAGTRKRR